YVERNALRANLVSRAEDWTWSSLWRRQRNRGVAMLADWPAERPGDWLDFVNEPQTAAELEALRQSVNRGCTFGGDDWQRELVERMGLQATLRPRGRPRNTATQEAS
ncbi:MAG: transposase, partial [Tepidisphaeraceae bacterium]